MPQDLTPYEDPNPYRGGSFTVRGQPITSEQIAGYGAPPGLSTAGFVPEVGSASAPWATPGPRTGSPSSQLAIQPTRWVDVAPSVGYLQSPSGPQGALMQPTEDRFGGMLRGISDLLPQQQQPRTIRTTDPGAGYGMSPSGPTAQMPARQPQVQRQVPDLQPAPGYTINRTPWRGAGSDSPTSPYAKAPTYADRYSVQTDPRRLASGAAIRGADYGRSPSNPNWQPARTPKPMRPFYEGPVPGSVGGP